MQPRPRPKGREHIPSPPISDVESPIVLSPQQAAGYFHNKRLADSLIIILLTTSLYATKISVHFHVHLKQ